MSNAKHTPGPFHGRSELVNGRVMWGIYQGVEKQSGFSPDKLVAYFEKHQDAVAFYKGIYAAAPEMLEALKVVCQILERRPIDGKERHELVAIMGKAIAKAEGKES